MPKLTRWFIRLGLGYLIVALLLFVLVAWRRLWSLPGWVAALSPVAIHLLMVGWVLQIIIGVVYWMFPVLSVKQPRGDERLGWAVLVLLNLGLGLRAIGEPVVMVSAAPVWRYLLVASALLQWLGGMGFIVLAWGRVRARGRHR